MASPLPIDPIPSNPIAPVGEPEGVTLFDRLCLVIERHPLRVFGFQAALTVGVVLGGLRWYRSGSIDAGESPPVVSLAATDERRVLEPMAPEDSPAPRARPHARFAPARVPAEEPSHDLTDELRPVPGEDLAWSPAQTMEESRVTPPKGGRTASARQKAAFDADHKKFLSMLEDYANVVGPLNSAPEDDPLRGPMLQQAKSMSERIDQWVVRSWHTVGVVAAPPASDEEFLRRLYLDLTGNIPALNETRAFLADSRPDRREHLIELLLASPEHAEHMASQWVNVMLPMDAEMMSSSSASNFERWLRLKFQKNAPYNRVVIELINPGPLGGGGAAGLYNARRGMPEELAADTARVLLGVQIQCAQCHNHPFDRWTVEDFKGYVAFFKDASEFRNLEVAPRFLGVEEAIDAKSLSAARRALADWITARENPYFARATVNRLWGMMFGRGLVDPIDDLSPNHPPSHPQLLDELATYFVASGYDLRGLIRTLARTRAYQLSSQTPLDDPSDGTLFASMAIKNLSVETMIACLSQVMDDRLIGGPRTRPDDFLRREALERFGLQARGGTEYEGGIPQALWMMNGPVMNQLSQSRLVRSVSEENLSTNERTSMLFLAALARYPQPHEQTRVTRYLDKAGPSKRREALGDILWALLNSAEFTMNH